MGVCSQNSIWQLILLVWLPIPYMYMYMYMYLLVTYNEAVLPSPLNLFMYMYTNSALTICIYLYSIIESFEVVVSIYAQQLSLNENQAFVMPSLTLVAELVSFLIIPCL